VGPLANTDYGAAVAIIGDYNDDGLDDRGRGAHTPLARLLLSSGEEQAMTRCSCLGYSKGPADSVAERAA